MLTADAFGVLPPISKLSREQAMYHFLSGYTAKVAGTERGVSEPQATFRPASARRSWCTIRRVRHCSESKIDEHDVDCWLVNTGWTGGPYGVGHRISIAHTRAMVNAAIEGRIPGIVRSGTFLRIGIRRLRSRRADRRLESPQRVGG